MSTNSERIRENLIPATKDILSPEQMLRINGDGTEANPGIDANNRLIWGQVFLWPIAARSLSVSIARARTKTGAGETQAWACIFASKLLRPMAAHSR